MALTIGDLTAHMGFDDADFKAGVARTQAGIKTLDGNLKTVSASAALNTNKLRIAFGALATQVTGVNPVIARLGDTLGVFAFGSLFVSGVLIGIAAIGFAWKQLTKDSREIEARIDEQIKKFKELALQQKFGAKTPHLQAIANASADAEFLRERITERTAGIEGANKPRLGGLATGGVFVDPAKDKTLLGWKQQLADLVAGIETHRVELARIDADAAEAAEKAAELERKAAERAAPSVEDLNEKINELTSAAREASRILDLQVGILTGTIDPGDQIREGAAEAGILRRRAGAEETARRSRFMIGVTPERLTTPTDGSGLLKDQITKFSDAVNAFGDGVKSMVQGAFSKQGLANIGSDLAANAIGFISGKIVDGLGQLLSGVDRVALAMEKNARALSASSDFIKERLAATGVNADKILTAVTDVFDRSVVGELEKNQDTGHGQRTDFRTALIDSILGDAKGIASNATRQKISDEIDKAARALGLDLSTLGDILDPAQAEALLSQFAQALTNAGVGIDDLGEAAKSTAEALRNVPSGFKVALAAFEATQGVSQGSVGAASAAGLMSAAGITVNQMAPVYIDANSKPVDEAYDEWLREDVRRQAKGGGSGARTRGVR